MKKATLRLFILTSLLLPFTSIAGGKTQNALIFEELVKRFKKIPAVFVECGDPFRKRTTYEDLVEDPVLLSNLELKKNQIKLNEENSLGFQNKAEDFACVAEKTYGYCGGMTKLTKRLAYLGFFDPTNLSREIIPNVKREPEAWRKFYTQRLERISDGHAEVIPGFRNLHEISTDPVLSVEVKRLATEKWAEDALSISGLSIFLRARTKMSVDSLASQVAKLQQRVERHEMPRILFSAYAPRPVGGVRIHSVTVWKVDQLENGNYRLWAWETNSGTSAAEIARNYIEVRPDGTMFYEPWYLDHVANQKIVDPQAGFVARITTVKEDLGEMTKIAKEIGDFCDVNPLCRKLAAAN